MTGLDRAKAELTVVESYGRAVNLDGLSDEKRAYLVGHGIQHFAMAGNCKAIRLFLTSFEFVQHSVNRDVFEASLSMKVGSVQLPVGDGDRAAIEHINACLRRNLQFLARHPGSLFQTVWNDLHSLDNGDSNRIRELCVNWRTQHKKSPKTHCWLRAVTPPLMQSSQASCLELSLSGHLGSVAHLAFSRDSRRLVSASVDRVMTWDAFTGEAIHEEVMAAGSMTNCISQSGDFFLATTRQSRTQATFALREVHPPSIVASGELDIFEAAISKNAKRIVYSYGERSDVTVFDVGSEESVLDLPARGRFCDFSLAPSGEFLVIAYIEVDTVRLIDLRSKEAAHIQAFDKPFSVTISPNEQMYGAVARGKKIVVWSVATGEELYSIDQEEVLGIETIAFSPCGKFLAAGSRFGEVVIWDLEERSTVFWESAHTHGVGALAFDPTGRLVASGGYDAVRIWSWEKNPDRGATPISRIDSANMHTEKVFAIRAGGPAGEVLSAAWSREVLLWDTVTGEAAKLLDIEFCTHLEVSCDWRTIFVAGGDRVWCYNRDGQETWDYDFSQEEVTAMSLDGGGALLAVATGIGGGIEGGYRLRRIHIVDVETKARVITFEGHDADIVSLCFSHDRSRLASGASDGSLAVWLVVDPFDGARWATAPEDDPNLGLQIAYEKPFDSPVKELGFLASKNELIVQLEDVWHLNIKSMEKKMLVQGGFSPQTRTSLEGLLGVVSAVHQDLETEVRASDGQVVGFLPARLSHVACDPDRLLICGSEGPVVHIYEAVFDDTDAS